MELLINNPAVGILQNLGGWEIPLIIAAVLILFGGKKLPEFARGAGQAIREFKTHSKNAEQTFKQALNEEEPATKAPAPTQTEAAAKETSAS
ncbi:MAG: twin-arginine translocase TatA/TatE family subunit [Verrucomicrobiota bacterium]